MKVYTPSLPLTLKGNQYGFPCKTYYYVVDSCGLIYHHSDKVWRKKSLIELWTHGFRSIESAITHFNEIGLTGKPRGVLTIPAPLCLEEIENLSAANDYDENLLNQI
jgi:hypothetical protein